MTTPTRSGLVCSVLGAFLLACGGGGGGDSVQTSSGGNVLFAVDSNHGVVGAMSSLNPPAGSSVAITQILEPTLGPSIACDPGRDELYLVSNSSIKVISNASRASGTPAPSRTITLPYTTMDVSTGTSLYLDVADDVLYVGGYRGINAAVITAISSASSANGLISSARVMELGTGTVKSFTVDATRSMLYVINTNTIGVSAYTNALAASGSISPAYTFMTGVSNTNWLTVDTAHDRLYVADVSSGIRIVNQASSLPGHADGGTVLLPLVQYVTVDSGRDRLYAGAASSAYIFNAASTLGSGSTAPGSLAVAPSGSNIAGFAFR